jgi:hypothetical protein
MNNCGKYTLFPESKQSRGENEKEFSLKRRP